jgi:hypothetical protein
MQHPSNDHAPRPLMRHLDHALGEVNVFLLAVAIGLATLDVTCFVTLRVAATTARQLAAR